MKPVNVVILAGSLSVLAWSQGMPQNNAGTPAQPAQQNSTQPTVSSTGAQQTASAGASTISGCMQESWGRYLIADSATNTTYDVRGSGTRLANHENHMVQVKGLPDTKSAQNNVVPFYSQRVQDSGQGCGPNAGMNEQATGQTVSQPTATAQTPAAGVQAQPAQPAAPQTGTSTTSQQPQPTQSGAAPSADTMQPGGSTETSAQPNGGMEEKGTPAAGTPSQSVGAPAGTSGSSAAPAEPQSNLSTFNGCLSGKENQYKFEADGKAYRLQGNTMMLKGMTGHQVEITGEDFNGKAIQVNGARDLGSSCSK